MSRCDQALFRRALLDPDHPVPEALRDGQDGAAGRRFAVYRNNVATGLRDAVTEGFPTLRALVGEAAMQAIARPFLRAHPPASPLMFRYGEALPTFLEEFPPVAHLGYLADVARLDLALRAAYHAADAAPIELTRLSALPPEGFGAVRLILAPAVRILRSPWPLYQIWRLALRDGPPLAAAAEDLLITRPGFEPELHLLPPGGAAFALALRAGQSVEEAATSAALDEDTLANLLALLLNSGAVTDMELPR